MDPWVEASLFIGSTIVLGLALYLIIPVLVMREVKKMGDLVDGRWMILYLVYVVALTAYLGLIMNIWPTLA